MRRNGFGVVTTVTVILAFMAGIRARFESSIPPPPANSLAGNKGDYLERAIHQPIDWRAMGEEPFRIARQRALPVLLVLGSPWSRLARQVDHDAFSNGDVARLIARDFIPVRVDLAQQPKWVGSFLPMRRFQMRFQQGFQCWVLDTQGRVVFFIGRDRGDAVLDHTAMLNALNDARRAFEKSELTTDVAAYTDIQYEDKLTLRDLPVNEAQDWGANAFAVVDGIDPVHGGFPQHGLQYLFPWAWQFLLRSGRDVQLRASLDPILFSPMVDWIHGGFYRCSQTADFRSIQFDKSMTNNADMLEVLADLAVLKEDPLYGRVAHDTFDWIVSTVDSQGYVPAAQKGKEDTGNRSEYGSYSPVRLRQDLDGVSRDWVRRFLGLRVETNPQMIPFLTSREPLDDSPVLDRILVRLRDSASVESTPVGDSLLDVNGSVAARLMTTARLWGDAKRVAQVIPLMERLERFRIGNDVVHVPGNGSDEGTYLGDYLGYADAMLADYLTTGRVPSFENGLAVLNRATDLFRGAEPGEYLTSSANGGALAPQNIDVPELMDSDREACSAQMLRLQFAYGRLLGPRAGRSLRADARETLAKYGSLAQNGAGHYLSGLLSAGTSIQDPAAAYCVGPHSQTLADALFRLRPTRLVAAVEGPVRPDLAHRAPGVYVEDGASLVGPVSVEEAARRLPAVFRLGL